MPRRVYTKEELLKAWKEKEERLKKEQDEVEAMKNIFETKCCRDCENSFYRYVPPTGCFTKPSEYCGCRKKVKMVDPNGSCQSFVRKH